MTASHDISTLLIDWSMGNDSARDTLVPLIYGELRRVAKKCLDGERRGHTLQPTALVHETYIRLVQQSHPDWKNRAHFFAVVSQLMRQILVDHARKSGAAKRGGKPMHASLDECVSFCDKRRGSVLALNDALTSLEAFDPRKCKIVELRFFGGLSVQESAQVLGVSVATIGRELKVAEAWLYREMNRS